MRVVNTTFYWSLREQVPRSGACVVERLVPIERPQAAHQKLALGRDVPRARGLPHVCPLSARGRCVSTSSLFSSQGSGTRVRGSRAPGKSTVDTAELLHRLVLEPPLNTAQLTSLTRQSCDLPFFRVCTATRLANDHTARGFVRFPPTLWQVGAGQLSVGLFRAVSGCARHRVSQQTPAQDI